VTTTPLLVVESATVRLWRGSRSVLVLDDVSLELGAGEFGGIWADRSAGKTILARLAAGLITPESGRVLLDGRVVADPSYRDEQGSVRAEIGLAATRPGPAMPDLPVATWVASAMLASCSWAEARHRAGVVLGEVGVAEVAGEPWANLSESERTLVAIARAVVRGPRLLIVDDPVAGLGAMRRAKVMKLLHGIAAGGVAVLMTAAEVVDLKGADRIWSLTDGHLRGPSARGGGELVELHPTGRARSSG
jgi:ABC-type multidrug transport system ATPase subunit